GSARPLGPRRVRGARRARARRRPARAHLQPGPRRAAGDRSGCALATRRARALRVSELLATEIAAVLGTETVESVESLRSGPLGATVGVWRVRAGGGSAVLKLLRHEAGTSPNWASSLDPSHPRWWRREYETLTSGVLDRLQPELRAPRLLLSADRPDGSLALW